MADKTDTIKTRLAFDGEAEYKAACKELNSNLKLLGSEMKLVTAEYKNNASSTEALKAKQDVLQRTYDEQAKKVGETEKALEAMKKAQGDNSEGAKRLETALNQQKAALADTKSALDKVADELENGEKEADKFGNEVEESGKKAEEAGGKFEGLKNIGSGLADAFTGLAAGAAAVGGALVAGFGYSVNAADEAKGAMNDFMAATGEATEKTEDYKQVMENIYNSNFGEGFEDIAAAMQEVKQQAGDIGAEELESMTTNALMLRDTFDFEVNESMRAAKMLMQQFGLSGTEAYNLIAQGAQKGLNKNGDLLDTINEYGVHYAQMGMSAEEMFNTLANGAEAGTFSVDKLGDAYKEFGIRVKDGSESTETAFALLGLTISDNTEAIAESKKEIGAYQDKIGDLEKKIKYAKIQQEGFNDKTSDLTKMKTADSIAEWESELEKLKGELDFTTRNLETMEASAAAGGQTAGDLFDRFNAGGEEAKAATQEVLDALFAMEDKTAQNAAGVALFGTMWEDLGAEGIQALTNLEGEISLTTDALGQINEIKYDTFGEAMDGVGRILQTSFILPIGNEALPLFSDFANTLSEGAKNANGDIGAMAETFGAATGQLVSGIAEMIPAIAAMASELVLGLTNGLVNCAPQIITAGVDLIGNLVAGLVQAIPQIAESAIQIISTLVQGIINLLPTVIEGAVQLVVTLAQGIAAALPELVPQIVELVLFIVETLVANLPTIIEAAVEIILALATGLIDALPMLAERLPEIIIAIVNGLIEALPTVIEAAGEIILALATGLIEALPTLIDALPDIVIAIVEGLAKAVPKVAALMQDLIKKVNEIMAKLPVVLRENLEKAVTRLVDWGKNMGAKAKSAMSDLINEKVVPVLKELPGEIWDAIIKCVDKIADWGKKMKDKAKSAMSTVCTTITDTFKDLPGNMLNIGKNLVEGLWNGISNMGEWISNKIKGFGDGVLGSIKNFFGIKSPSRKMRDEVGVFLAQGVGVGFTDEMERVSRDINESIPREFDVRSKVNFDTEMDDEPERPKGSGRTAGGVTVIQNIYAKDTSYKAQQKEAAKQFRYIAREVVA